MGRLGFTDQGTISQAGSAIPIPEGEDGHPVGLNWVASLYYTAEPRPEL